MEGLIILIFTLGIGHLINWLLTKGVIWVMLELFNINWYERFWVVYVMLILFDILIKGIGKVARQ